MDKKLFFRFERFMNRNSSRDTPSVSTSRQDTEETEDIFVDEAASQQDQTTSYVDQGCQVNTCVPDTAVSSTFTCNRWIYGNGSCDAEIQTEILQCTRLLTIPNRKQLKDKKCGTSLNFADQSTQYDIKNDVPQKKHFEGFASIENDEQL